MVNEIKVSEADLQSNVLDTARLLGWTVAHFRAARVGKDEDEKWRTPVAADGKGFPDLVLAHPKHGVLFRELKSAAGRLSPEQRRWIDVLDAAGADVDVWRPCHLDDVIPTTLRGGTP